MNTIRVNAREFERQYGLLIPMDILKHFTQCFLKGETYTEIRDTVLDEIKINKFYKEHPEVRPYPNIKLSDLSREVINLMKSHIKGEEIEDYKFRHLLVLLGKKDDEGYVYNYPTEELKALYDDVLWLRGQHI
nr:MAG TPA: hypothetical protein [Caudoviricetes sp.]